MDTSSDENPETGCAALLGLATVHGPDVDLDPWHILSDDSAENQMYEELMYTSDDSHDDDSAYAIDPDDLDDLRHAARFRRRAPAWLYSGDLMKCILGAHEEEKKNWASLPEDERYRRWMYEFRMDEQRFDVLLELVQPHIQPTEARHPLQCSFAVQSKLLITLIFLAHCPSLRSMSNKWGVPHNSISVYCIHSVVPVLRQIFTVNENTKNIKWPRQPDDIRRTKQGFMAKYQLPGCLLAVDGSLIPQRKPTREQANQDQDSYFGYKGVVCSLLLCCCDSDLIFRYVNAGAPGCVGDSGLFSRSQLKDQIDQGLLQTEATPLNFLDGSEYNVWPYIVGDAAFPLGTHILKCYEPSPPQGSPEAKFNRKIINARRVIERAFGRLKGRWVFCAKNTFWGDVNFTRSAIVACCGLHNFLEMRHVEMFEEDDGDDDADHMLALPPDAHVGGIGVDVRSQLARWVGEQYA
jgi:hypothetical protein